MKIPLDPAHAKSLTFQDYAPAPAIDGVFTAPLTKHRAIEGSFLEYLRLSGGKVEGLEADFPVRQVSLARAAGGRINAFHVHPKQVQNELWTVIEGAMQVWLVDIRAGSPTRGVKRRFLLSGEQPALLHIPAGVAHGYQAAPGGALLLYAMDSQFDPADPNEGRLPWDHFGRELWEEDRG
ncbi:MAG TPA: dTDP-4-dehydrorhamnose 3,5-epimerase family protein [Phycisphaerae bacterium]|nr:dTDP-4-dehydrorhamnose 3,5-epimerase family protein [Phycisphaerae bacterium]